MYLLLFFATFALLTWHGAIFSKNADAMKCFHFDGSRLKLGNGFQYVLNAEGSTPAQVMGIDYKSTVKPGLESFADDIKKNSMAKLEELISLQQESSELTAKIEGKKNRIAALQSNIDEVCIINLLLYG